MATEDLFAVTVPMVEIGFIATTAAKETKDPSEMKREMDRDVPVRTVLPTIEAARGLKHLP